MFRRVARGVSLAEVLVASSILLLLSVVFSLLLTGVRSNSSGGSKRIEMRANHRESQRRLTLLLRQAVEPNELDPALIEPIYEQSGVEVRFNAPEDLLESVRTFDPRNPVYEEFWVRLNAGSGSLLVSRSDLSGPVQRIGRNFDTVDFFREHKRSLRIRLTSSDTIRGATGEKAVTESSENVVRLPGIR